MLLINETQKRIPRKFLLSLHAKLKNHLPKKHRRDLEKELVVVFVGLRRGQELNLQFRGRDYPTDVLSFQTGDAHSLGDLVICLPVIEKQAKRQGWSVRLELAYMVIHGILHLLGYDHERSKSEAKIMFRLQDQTFEGLFSHIKLDNLS